MEMDENVALIQNGQAAEIAEQDNREKVNGENVEPTFDRDDQTVARRLHEISAKKNEWKRIAEEYRQKYEELEQQLNDKKPQQNAQTNDMEQVFKEDLMAIKKAFPFVRAEDVRQLPNLKTFAKLRDAGLDAVQAFRASATDEIIDRAIESGKGKAEDNKAHLTAIGTQARSKAPDSIPMDVMPIWRSAFPKLSERELTALYNKNK